MPFDATAPAAAVTTIARPGRVDAELIASSLAPRPGTTIILGVRMAPRPGWHGYWSNPGESGLAPTARWITRPGVRLGRLEHPAPTLLRSMGLVSFVHSGPHVLVSRMTVSSGIQPGTPIPVSVDLNWAACSATQCVPEHARLSLQMVAGDGAKSLEAPALSRAVKALPRPGPSSRFATHEGRVILELPGALHLDARRVRFFPDTNGYFDAAQARATADSLSTIEAPETGRVPNRIDGVVSDGSSAYRLSFRRDEGLVSPQQDKPGPPPPSRPTDVQAAVSAVSPAPQDGAVKQPVVHSPKWLVRSIVLLGLIAFAAFAAALARRSHR